MTKRSKEFLALDPQRQLFVAEYIIDFNATRSYTAAGYTGKNADVHGPRIATHPDIQAAIQAETNILLADLKITPAKILRDLEQVRLTAMGSGKLNAANRAIELQAKYVNAFPNQYRSSFLDDVPPPDPDANSAEATPIEDVARGLAFLLARAVRAKGAKPPEATKPEAVTLQ